MSLLLKFVQAKAARFACEHWHYSGCLPSGKLVNIGVWEHGKFIGVVIFSRGASPFLFQKYNFSQTDGCELTRVALTSHQTNVSRILSIALRMLKKSSPGLRLVVSFADPEEGHAGGIYKAGNWIYTGTSSATVEYFVGGKWRHVRSAHHRKTAASPVRTRQGKHRYLMPLDEETRNLILPLAKPYPERARSTDSGATGVQPGGGGASPTRALDITAEQQPK